MALKDLASQPSTWNGLAHVGVATGLFTTASGLSPTFTAFGLDNHEWAVIMYIGGVLLLIAGALGIFLKDKGTILEPKVAAVEKKVKVIAEEVGIEK